MVNLHIGFDDTDSTRKGCTTYIAAVLVEKLERLGARFTDYPNLVRLNPNVPWKTRGNGALCLRIQCNKHDVETIKETVIDTIEQMSDLDSEGTDPGIVFLEKIAVQDELSLFSKKTITEIVNMKEALRLLKRFRATAIGFKDGRGIIGATAAIGETLRNDHTYEILAYRIPSNCGKERMVDEGSIFAMDEATKPFTFNNVDAQKKRVIITPRGADPILLGIRGESPEIVKSALMMVKSLEPIERWVIFRTNQGTDAHLKAVSSLREVKPYDSIVAKATVASNPMLVPKRHVIFSVKDDTKKVDCAAYEPTGILRKVAAELSINDTLEIYGGVRKPSSGRSLTVNLEKINVLKVVTKQVSRNPVCTRCGRRLESMGRSQGFRCDKCGMRYPNARKIPIEVFRDLALGLYVTSERSQRHLTKPLRRYGLEKDSAVPACLIDGWHSV